MLATEKNLKLTLVYHNEKVVVNTFENEFPDLRELIMVKLNLDDFGECGGVGRCVTCLVDLDPKQEVQDFACQVPIDKWIANCNIKVIGDRLKPL